MNNQSKPRKFQYEYFSLQSRRMDIYNFSKRLTEYVEASGIVNIAFIDRSARAAWMGLNTYWDMHYKPKPKPKMYFFNPESFNFLWIKKDFERIFHVLLKEKDKPLVLFDVCAHTGRTLQPVLTVLKKLGFTNVQVITARAPVTGSNITTVCKLDANVNHEVGCYIFGRTSLVEKGFEAVCERTDRYRDLHEGILIRKEIRQIIIEEGM